MSFVKGGITFYEPPDLPLITSMSGQLADGMLVYVGNSIKRIEKANFFTGNLPFRIYLQGVGSAAITTGYGFIVELSAKPVVFNLTSGQNIFYLYSPFMELRLYRSDSIVRAGSFVQWSGKNEKTDIQDFEKNDLLRISPKRYTDIGGRSRIGFMAEDIPSDYVSDALDDEQKPNVWRKGIDLMAMVASLWKSVQELAKRIENLEKKQ